MPDRAGVLQLCQGAECFLQRGVGVETVHIQQIDRVLIQLLAATVKMRGDIGAACPAGIADLGRDIEVVTVLLDEPAQQFFNKEASSSILLIAATVIALVWINSDIGETYHGFWHTKISFTFGYFHISKTLLHWVNDGLMSLFFFTVGLEIKREILVGELATPKKALLPVIAALGGMVVPGLIYVAFNIGSPTIHGWGIPVATDIAFALGAVAVFGRRLPVGLRIFLAAFAIADDLGAVLVIAIFYSSEISWLALGVGAIFLAALVASAPVLADVRRVLRLDALLL